MLFMRLFMKIPKIFNKNYRLTRRRLRRIEEAYQTFVKDKALYMCTAFAYTCDRIDIPEFNSVFLTGIAKGSLEPWWDIRDRESRIKAFEYLIKIYENKLKEF